MGSVLAGVSPTRLVFADGLERTLDRERLRIGRSPEMDVMLVSAVCVAAARAPRQPGRALVSQRPRQRQRHPRKRDSVAGAVRGSAPPRDRVEIGGQTFTFSDPAQLADSERTDVIDATPRIQTLSPLQAKVIRILCQPYLERGYDAQPPTNAEIAAAARHTTRRRISQGGPNTGPATSSASGRRCNRFTPRLDLRRS